MKERLYKENAVIVIYDKLPGDDFFGLDIRKDYGDYIGGFNGHIEFEFELEELEIFDLGDEYIYEGDLSEIRIGEKRIQNRIGKFRTSFTIYLWWSYARPNS